MVTRKELPVLPRRYHRHNSCLAFEHTNKPVCDSECETNGGEIYDRLVYVQESKVFWLLVSSPHVFVVIQIYLLRFLLLSISLFPLFLFVFLLGHLFFGFFLYFF